MEKQKQIPGGMTLQQCREALDKRQISARELTEACLDRIEKGEVGAWLAVCRDRALEAADRADRLLAEKPENTPPLLGIPYGCKDNLVTKGIPTTCGSRMLENYVSPFDAAAVEKMEAGGAVMLGKTNMDAFAMGSSGENSAYRTTVNPLDRRCSPGGSSSGSAASVAAGEAVFSLGSDTGGSARQPASLCGLVAMKPTYGLVSRYGLVEFASSMDTVCPITRTVEDNRIVLSAMAGRDPRDMTAAHLPDPWYSTLADTALTGDLRGKRIAVVADGAAHCDAAVWANTVRAAGLAETAGAAVEEVSLPSADKALEIYVILTAAEASSNLARYDGIRYGRAGQGDSYREICTDARTGGFGTEVVRRILTGAYALTGELGGVYFHKIREMQMHICRETEELLKRYDGILMPTTGGTAFPLAADASEKANERYECDRYTVYANLTGLPAIQLPSGGDGHLPTGVSLLGRRFGETELYRMAKCLEEAMAEYVWQEADRDDSL